MSILDILLARMVVDLRRSRTCWAGRANRL